MCVCIHTHSSPQQIKFFICLYSLLVFIQMHVGSLPISAPGTDLILHSALFGSHPSISIFPYCYMVIFLI